MSPCHCSETNRSSRPANSGSARPSAVSSTVEQADLRPLGRVDAGAERRRQQLHPEADAEERPAGLDRLAHQLALGREPRVVGVVAGAHRPAHRQHRVELAPVGQRLALVDLDRDRLGAALAHHLAEHPGVLAGDVLEDEDAHPPTRSGQLFFWLLPVPASDPGSDGPWFSTLATSPVVASMRTTASCGSPSGRRGC